MKIRKVFICSNCGTQSTKWEGKCGGCGEWGTFEEEIIHKDGGNLQHKKGSIRSNLANSAKPVLIGDIETGTTSRLEIGDKELNRVLGGGLVLGSLILVGGQPGIGKSTLMLQLALQATSKVLYVSGEESEEQIKMRAERIPYSNKDCYILTETNCSKIIDFGVDLKPSIVIVDSIQTMSSELLDSAPGSISQIKECTAELQRFAKEFNIPVFIIGHITKDGSLAGPKVLEHIVDAVLQFEGDRNYTYRILRSTKNRFGSTDELGIYEMHADGLRPVTNPSELLLSQRDEPLSGSSIAATMEGRRSMLIETQALVSTAVYGNPQRTTTGFDLRRLNMLLAVLEKRCGFRLGQMDVFLNIAGGIRVDDPGIDLAIVSAIVSSYEDIAIPENVCFAGEVGLSGEIRSVNRIDQRIQEAARLGFTEMYISKYNTKGLDIKKAGISIHPIGELMEIKEGLFQ